MKLHDVEINEHDLATFCQRNGASEFFFGPIVREPFEAHSDIDILVEHDPVLRRPPRFRRVAGTIDRHVWPASASADVQHASAQVRRMFSKRRCPWLRRLNRRYPCFWMTSFDLEHIQAAAQDLIDFCKGSTRDGLDVDPMFRRAVVPANQEIGDASSKMTFETRSLLPDIPWEFIVQMRHIVVHLYRGVDLDRVWTVAVTHVPALFLRVEQSLARAQPFPQSL